MANVLFTRTSDPSSKPITDGQLIFDTSGNGKMYLDNGTTRLEMGGAINVDSTLDATSTNPIQNKAVAGVMLNTLKEINAVTTKGKLTDALATKELNTKVTDLETDVSSLTDDYVSKGKILESLEEVTTATNAGFVPDALAIKELNRNLIVPDYKSAVTIQNNYICTSNGYVIGTIQGEASGWASIRSSNQMSYFLALCTSSDNPIAVCIPFAAGDTVIFGNKGIYNLAFAPTK